MSLMVWVPGGGAWLAYSEGVLQSSVTLLEDDDVPAQSKTVRVLVSGTPRREWLEALPALEFVLIPYAGVPPRTAALLREFPHVRLHNLHHNADPTAELALALVLAVAKRIVPADRQLREGDWRFRYAPPVAWTLAGRSALVFGWGAIGARVGGMLRALGMTVRGVARTARRAGCGTEVCAVADLDACLSDTDLLVLTAAATDETRGLFNADRLARLPSGALLVNVARGALVDESALYEALRSGHVGGAGLDVWWRYPREEEQRANCPPSEHDFSALDQVVFSPHRGGSTTETDRLRGEGLAVLLDQIAGGQMPSNSVDPTAGY